MVVRNKRGMFFLMVTLIVVSLFILSITFYSDVASRRSVQKRVETLSDFVSSSEADLSRQIFITGYRAIFFMEKEIVDTGNYLDTDANSIMQEIFFNGTINGEPEQLLQGITFSRLSELMDERSARISAETEFSNPRINLTQDDPWSVKVVFIVDAFVSDKSGLASWNKTLVVESNISIFNFTDPVYFVETEGSIAPPTFVQTPYSEFDVSTLSAHITGNFYRAHSDAPSFLDRLEGNLLADSENGIESLVYVEDIPVAYRHDKSIVDHIYFSSESGGGCQLSGMPSWAELDEVHRVYYGSIGCS